LHKEWEEEMNPPPIDSAGSRAENEIPHLVSKHESNDRRWAAALVGEVDVMARGTLRHHFDEFLGDAEMAIYSVLAVLLSATIVAAIASACKLLFDSVIHWTVAAQSLRVLNEMLVVLMLAETLQHGSHFHSLARSGH
jgi:hypothetical protein